MKWIGIVLIILLLGLHFRLWVGEGSLAEVWAMKSKIVEQEQHNDQLELRNELLKAEVADLKRGLEAIEERARMNLGMIKEGETFYRLVENPKNQVHASE